MKILIPILYIVLSPLASAGGSIGADGIKKLLPRATKIVKAKIVKSRIIAVFDNNGFYVGANFEKIKVSSVYTVIHCADLSVTETLYGTEVFLGEKESKNLSITWTDLAINHKGHIKNSDCPHVSEKAQSKIDRIWTLIEKNGRWKVLADSDPKVSKQLLQDIKEYKKNNPAEVKKSIFG